ncbi:trefoil factor 2 (spasmolytic protein 1), isoform CRA_a [Rattus norvegicus]|uniref:Trefoil factor 2 n=1 Tax=Rattus norvegicus TaxID=10116 RepID=A6JJY4_RAT|nr:trefoil factor 2 (spasmolytic protein 1), isoform CRA_a [Rattus norvegicus]
MGPRGAPLLVVVLVLGLHALAEGEKPSPCRCSRMTPSNRKNCGFPGITSDQCFNLGCCFDSSVAGVPWFALPLDQRRNNVSWRCQPARTVGTRASALRTVPADTAAFPT